MFDYRGGSERVNNINIDKRHLFYTTRQITEPEQCKMANQAKLYIVIKHQMIKSTSGKRFTIFYSSFTFYYNNMI